MKKKIKLTPILLALLLTFGANITSCDDADDDTAGSTDTVSQTEQTTEAPTDADTQNVTDREESGAQLTSDSTNAPNEDTQVPETDAAVTDAAATNAPVTNAPTTNAPETKPITTEPTENTTKATVTAPVEDPSVDYSKWGYYGFEKLLPAPLPFEARWISRNTSQGTYNVQCDTAFNPKDAEKNINILKDYIKSLEAYGYSSILTTTPFFAFNENGDFFEFIYTDNCVCVSITLA